MKDGKEHDSTGVVYFGLIKYDGDPRLVILDWDVVQMDAALLEDWLPSVTHRLDDYCRRVKVRAGSLGAFIEDASAGSVLIQLSSGNDCQKNRPASSCARAAQIKTSTRRK